MISRIGVCLLAFCVVFAVVVTSISHNSDRRYIGVSRPALNSMTRIRPRFDISRFTPCNSRQVSVHASSSNAKIAVRAGIAITPVVWALYGTPLAVLIAGGTAYKHFQDNPIPIELPDHFLERLSDMLSTTQRRILKKETHETPASSPEIIVSAATPTPTRANLQDSLPSRELVVELVDELAEDAKTASVVIPWPVPNKPPPPPPPPPASQSPASIKNTARKKAKKSHASITREQCMGVELGRKFDPIKHLAYGGGSVSRGLQEAQEIMSSFDPLNFVADVQAPKGEFLLDPMSAVSAWVPKAKVDGEETFFRKLDPVRDFATSLEEVGDITELGSQGDGKGVWKVVNPFLSKIRGRTTSGV